MINPIWKHEPSRLFIALQSYVCLVNPLYANEFLHIVCYDYLYIALGNRLEFRKEDVYYENIIITNLLQCNILYDVNLN